MKLPVILCAALLPLFASCASGKKAPEAAPMSEQEMTDKWMAFARPGPEHKVLDAKVGRWSIKIEHYMAPDAPPMQSEGTSEAKWAMDGRYLIDNVSSSMMGMPFTGMGITGYDNLHQKYVFCWIDNMGTGLTVGDGRWDAATKTLTSTMQTPDPVRGGMSTMRMVERWTGPDSFNVEFWGIGMDGKDGKQMEMRYSRAR